jgi:hypothetical protein
LSADILLVDRFLAAPGPVVTDMWADETVETRLTDSIYTSYTVFGDKFVIVLGLGIIEVTVDKLP